MTLSDAYSLLKTGTLWSSTGRCKGFAQANPGEAAKIDAYVQGLMAGGSPAAPALLTATGNGLVGMLAALAPTAPPPPPPPTGTNVGNGYICDLQGTRYAQMADSERQNYGGITVGFGNEIDVATFEKTHPSCHGFGYQTSIEIGTNTWYGAVLIDTARQNGWILKDASGVEVSMGAGQLAGDITHPGYQAAWCAYVRDRAAATGLNRKFLDNVTGELMLGSWFRTVPAKLPTDAALQDAYVKFLAYQQANLPGIYRVANTGPAQDRWAWWKKVAPFVDGLMLEYFDGTDAHLALLTAAQDAGRDAWALVDFSAGHDTAATPGSARAKYLAQRFASVWNRKGGGFGLVGVGVWDTNWASAIA